MPYQSNNDLPKRIRDAYDEHQQTVFRETFNSVYEKTKDEGMAFAIAHKQAKAATNSETLNDFSDWIDGDITTQELMKGAFGSSGGKSKVLKKILVMIPPHNTYVEPFAGGAAVFFGKEPARREALNDLNKDVYSMYNFIKTCTDEEITKLRNYNWLENKELFFKLRDSDSSQLGRLDAVYRFYYLMAYSYGINMKTFGYKGNRNFKIFDRLPALRERLKNTDVYNGSYEAILGKYDSESTFFFFDPPYPREWAGPEGLNLWGEKNVDDFIVHLKSLKGKFVVTLNNVDWVHKKFQDAGFNCYLVPVPRSFSHAHQKALGYKQELFATNYKLSPEVEKQVTSTDNINVINYVVVSESFDGKIGVELFTELETKNKFIAELRGNPLIRGYNSFENILESGEKTNG